MVNRAFDKIRQASRGMPAVLIRMLDALTSIASETSASGQRGVLMRQAKMILQSADETVDQANDLEDVRLRYRRLTAVAVSSAGMVTVWDSANSPTLSPP